MKPEEGIATVALGLGKTVMEGEKALRFSPRYPQLLPQRSTVEDVLENSQQLFYALNMGEDSPEVGILEDANLAKRDVSDADEEAPVCPYARLSGTDLCPGFEVWAVSPG
jgi:hypothetical protein